MPLINSAEVLKLSLPASVGVKDIPALLKIADSIKASTEDIQFDCSKTVWFDPYGITILVSILEGVDNTRRISMLWLSRKMAGYLERMDFFSRIVVHGVDFQTEKRRNDQSGNLLEITLIRDAASAEEIAERLAKAVVGAIIGREQKPIDFHNPDEEYNQYYDPIRYALSELIENAITHARREGRRDASVWVASQFYKFGGDIVHLAVVDNGCGFLATLKNHPMIAGATHADAVLVALKPKVSCNRDAGPFAESVNQGVGLTTTVKIAKATGG